MKLIGMSAIMKHFNGQIGEDVIRRWIKDFDFPIAYSKGDKGTIMADSDLVDRWFICFTLKQSFPKVAAEIIADRIMSRPELAVKTRKPGTGGR